MKYRVADLLQCPCGSSDLILENTVVKTVPFGQKIPEVKCARTCAFKKCSVDQRAVTVADCTECYTKEITDGAFRCRACGQKWPIIGGIPRFLPGNLPEDIKKTQETFSHEWKMFRTGERNWGQDMDFRLKLFAKGLGAGPDETKGKKIFDAGCGSGALTIQMSKTFGMEVVGMDLAFGIENAYKRNDSPFVYFVQGSVLQPPIRKNAFDYLSCCGVLVAVPDPKGGFKAIVKALKRGGRAFIWVYNPISPTYFPHNWRRMAFYNFVRSRITSRLPIKVQYLAYLSLVPPFLIKQSIEKMLGRRPNPLTWREKMQSFFDFLSPIYEHRWESPEILGWYEEAGFASAEVAYRELEGFGVRGDLPPGTSKEDERSYVPSLATL